MFEITQGVSEMLHGDCLQAHIVHMRGILSIWRLALQRGKGGSDKQEATCVTRTGGWDFEAENRASSYMQ